MPNAEEPDLRVGVTRKQPFGHCIVVPLHLIRIRNAACRGNRLAVKNTKKFFLPHSPALLAIFDRGRLYLARETEHTPV